MINNKGMSLVEIIVTFSLALLIIIGLYNLILDVKTTLKDKEIVKSITDYSSLKNDEIQYSLITNKPFSFILKKNSNNAFVCKSNDNCKIDNNSAIITYKGKMRTIGKGTLETDYCKNIYPCIVYFYVNKGEIGTVTIALQDKDKNRKTLGAGILYGKEKGTTFEKVPNQKEVFIYRDNKDNDKNIYIDYHNKTLVINYPYFLKDSINYGFKIAYPFLEE